MNDEEKKEEATPASEDVVQPLDNAENEGSKPARQVPLEALEAERRKRQDAEAQIRLYQDIARQKEAEAKNAPEENSEDDEELVSRKELKQFHQKLTKEELTDLKREISEETFKDMQPEAIKLINTHLKEIIEKKPWLADSIANAPNRYARAFEIVGDYMPQVVATKKQATDVKKIIENAQKPGSPVATGKAQQLSGADYLKSIAGTKEFRNYRKKLLGK